MIKTNIFVLLAVLILVWGCSFADPDEKAIKEMLTSFVTSLERDDEDLGRACMLDRNSFSVLNPQASKRMDAEDFTERILSELLYSYRQLAEHYKGHELKLKKFTVGNVWYQYRGRLAFQNSVIIITVNGAEEEIPIKGLVKINQTWKIVDLSGIPGM